MAKKGKPTKSTILIWMEKNGVRLEIHPLTVEAHKAVGWKVVENPPSVVSEEPEKELEPEETKEEKGEE